MSKWLKEYLEIIKSNIILLVGTGLFVYNLFDFRHRSCSGISLSFGGDNDLVSYCYYYSDDGLTLLAIGAILMVVGILKLKNKNI